MLKIFLNIIFGLSCFLIMSCSAKITPKNFTETMESHLVDNNDGTFTDKRNLLQWTKNDHSPGPNSCYGGTKKGYRFLQLYLECLNERNYLGHNDWRMPSYIELESLLVTPEIKNETFFSSQVHERLKNHAYWSTANLAIYVYIPSIMIYNLLGPIYIYDRSLSYYVWPVRSENKIGQLTSFQGKLLIH